MRKNKSKPVVYLLCILTTLAVWHIHPAYGVPDYRGMVEQIDAYFQEALKLYNAGDVEAARLKAQAAYFEVFENLEGPIRINLSARKSYELEEEFGAIRNMIRDKQDVSEIEDRMKLLINELDAIVVKLETGFELKAESSNEPETEKPPAGDKDWHTVVRALFTHLEAAVELYEGGETEKAVEDVQNSYFDIFEASGLETAIGIRDDALKTTLEGYFSAMVSQMKSNAEAEAIHATVTRMRGDFERAAGKLTKGSRWSLFLYSLFIILREGFEAILIVTAIIAYLLKTGNRDKLGVIYNGCVTAIILSLITAVLVKWVFHISSASQELLEGFTMLLAAAVLFCVSFWLISKVEAKKWIDYIQGKVNTSLSSGSIGALWFAAFLAVYREGAETVLFYQALLADTGAAGLPVVASGFFSGCLLLTVVYVVMRFGAVKIPIRQFFIVTGIIIYYMAFVFTGKGMMELIEGKLIAPTLVSGMPFVPWLGVFPYAQTIIPQVILLLAAMIGGLVLLKSMITGRR